MVLSTCDFGGVFWYAEVAALWERFGKPSAPLNLFPSAADAGEWLWLAVASSSVLDLVGAKPLSGPFCPPETLVMHCWM